jgi:hypothetical protein
MSSARPRSLSRRVRIVRECDAAVDVVPPQPVKHCLDRLEGAFVHDQVAGEDVHWRGREALAGGIGRRREEGRGGREE